MHLILDPRSANGRKIRGPPIGIIIGVSSVIIGLLIIALIIFIVYRYRKRKPTQKSQNLPEEPPKVAPRLLINYRCF